MKYILNIFLIIFFIIISFIIINKLLKKIYIENFCKIPPIDPQGGKNDKKVLLDYKPQSSILTSSCDKYWKDWPLEFNNTQVENNPLVLQTNQLSLPKEKQFGNNDYKAGLVNFAELAVIISDKLDYDIFEKSKELLLDPVSKKKLEFKYELEFSYIELNKKTYVNRWKEYNPTIKVYFDYEDIKSPIEELNILNLLFKKRCDENQRILLTENQLILFGLIPFQIFKYRIININYLNNDESKPVYIIEISIFRETDLYLNTFSYVGFIENKEPIISNVKYIGRNSTDQVLLADFYNPNELKQEIINKNFSNSFTIEKDPDTIVKQTKEYLESYKLKNQYACFNLNYDPLKKNEYILPYYSRESCESSYDFYGKSKSIGVYDTPCKKDTDCPFFKINKNYENTHGKCMEDGYCELPSNMKKIGYRYYSDSAGDLPLCYNCKTDKFVISTELDSCCEDQYNREKYPFLKTPDYAFDNDNLDRINYFNQNFCKTKPNELNLTCNDIII